MKWSMTQLQKYKNKGMKLDEIVNLESIKKRDSQIREISPIHVTGTLDIDARKVTFHLHITGDLTLPSTRTLKDVSFPIDIHTTETFIDENMATDEEEETHIIKGEMIDLHPVLEDLIILEIPMQIYNEDEEIPSSQQSGKDWDFILDESQLVQDQIDPRLAKLKQLLDNQK